MPINKDRQKDFLSDLTVKSLDSRGNGVLSRIAENKPYEFILIKNYGVIESGAEKTRDQDVSLAIKMQES